MPICKGARVKIKRAEHHIAELETCINGLRKRLVVSAHIDAKSGCEFIQCGFAGIKESEIIEDISAIIGDAIHNLRCALDHVWIDTIHRLIPSGSFKRTQFPSFPTDVQLELKLRELQIDISAPCFFKFLTAQVQPYDMGDLAIRPVHILDIRDKHRLLIPVIYYSSIGGIYLEDRNGEIHKGSTWGTLTPFPHFLKFEVGLKIKDPGQVSFEVMFKDWNSEEVNAPSTLTLYSRQILKIVQLFEEFVEE